MPVKDRLLQELQQLRRDLHQHPEVSGEEHQTAARIKEFITNYDPDRVINGVGGDGMIFIFEGKIDGPTIMIRAELDALAIPELNDLPYASENYGKAHLCGHDGHMSIVAGVAAMVSENRPASGRVALLFQPAEEIGEGAKRMLSDDIFKEIVPNYIFALHNLPGFRKKEIIIKDDIFSSASKGIIIELQGKTSHAAEPENGISPAVAVAETILMIEQIPSRLSALKDFNLTTVVHAILGEKTFGVTPGKAVVMATIRAYQDDDLITMENSIKEKVQAIANKYSLEVQLNDTEIFSSTVNDFDCCGYVRNAARQLELSITEVDKPFRWSEDFGLFTQQYKGALFGLGSGEETPDLHNPDFNFPDDITETGILMFYKIIDQLLNKENA